MLFFTLQQTIQVFVRCSLLSENHDLDTFYLYNLDNLCWAFSQAKKKSTVRQQFKDFIQKTEVYESLVENGEV